MAESNKFLYFSTNGQILPIELAIVPLSNIEYSYGFGVYETLKVRKGNVYFVKQHVERLFYSAKVIGLTHAFTKKEIEKYIDELLAKQSVDACNIKMLLIGGREPQLFIIPLAPLFPDRKLYTQGAKTISVQYERIFPNAKTLNMLPSYLAYKKAKENGCYDALLISQKGTILEGTRSNFFAIKNNVLYTPPVEEVLEGVTRQTVIATAKKAGFILKETTIPLLQITDYDGAFLTSTSSKIIPITRINDHTFSIPVALKKLMKAYDVFLQESQGKFTS